MSVTAIVFIVLAVAMCVGPIMMMQPNAYQRRAAKLRSDALAMDLKVRLSAWVSREERPLPVYWRTWPELNRRGFFDDQNWCVERKAYAHELHLAKFWDWTSKGRASPQICAIVEERIAAIPECISAIEATPQGLGLVWDEQGGGSQLTAISVWIAAVFDDLVDKAGG